MAGRHAEDGPPLLLGRCPSNFSITDAHDSTGLRNSSYGSTVSSLVQLMMIHYICSILMHACYSQAAQADCLFAAVSMQFAYFSELSIAS